MNDIIKSSSLWIILIIIISLISAGLYIFNVRVERYTYETSYQYQEGVRERIDTLEASLAEIETRLSNPNLDDESRNNLEAQRAAILIQLRSAKKKIRR